jgi:DNA-binding protein H-NS
MKKHHKGLALRRRYGHARKTPFHVYAEDGFEGAYASERSARSHAKKGSKDRRQVYQVVVANSSGVTGGGRGRTIALYRHGREVDA